MDGSVSGTIVDLTASFQLTDKFKLGLNVDFSNEGKGLYRCSFVSCGRCNGEFSLGLRGEYFKYKEGSGDDSCINFSANLKAWTDFYSSLD
jgi:hypothetical protein